MDDTKIIDMLFMRSESALEKLSEKYTSLCTSVVKRVIENESDVEECVNDIRLAVWNSIPPERPNNLPAYLCTLARNTALNKLKYNKRIKRNNNCLVMFSELDDCIAYEENFNERFESERLRLVLSEFIRTLPKETRILFVRRYVYFESVKELAERYSMTENNINVKLYRARKQLEKTLKKEELWL